MKRRKFALILGAGLVVGGSFSSARNIPEKKVKGTTRAPVESSSIASIGYVTASRALEIEFRSGAVYRYLGVPGTVHAEFLTAESKGRYFSQHIRGRYEFVRMKIQTP